MSPSLRGTKTAWKRRRKPSFSAGIWNPADKQHQQISLLRDKIVRSGLGLRKGHRGTLVTRCEITWARNVNATSRPVLTWVDDCGCRAKSIALGESPRWSRPSPRREARGRLEIYTCVTCIYIYPRDACLPAAFVRRFLVYTGCFRHITRLCGAWRSREFSVKFFPSRGAIQSADALSFAAEWTIASYFADISLISHTYGV